MRACINLSKNKISNHLLTRPDNVINLKFSSRIDFIFLEKKHVLPSELYVCEYSQTYNY